MASALLFRVSIRLRKPRRRLPSNFIAVPYEGLDGVYIPRSPRVNVPSRAICVPENELATFRHPRIPLVPRRTRKPGRKCNSVLTKRHRRQINRLCRKVISPTANRPGTPQHEFCVACPGIVQRPSALFESTRRTHPRLQRNEPVISIKLNAKRSKAPPEPISRRAAIVIPQHETQAAHRASILTASTTLPDFGIWAHGYESESWNVDWHLTEARPIDQEKQKPRNLSRGDPCTVQFFNR